MRWRRAAQSDTNVVKHAITLLSDADRRKYRFAVLLQMGTSLLDLVGVLLFGLVGLLAAATQASPPPSVSTVLDALGLGDASTLEAAGVVAVLAAVVLVTKSLVTLFINRRVGLFLARCAAKLSEELSQRFFQMPIDKVQQENSQLSAYALSMGVNALMIDVLSNAMTAKAEIALLSILSLTLLVLDPLTTAVAVAYFGIVVLVLNLGLSKWSLRVGEITAATDIAATTSVQDGIATYREITVAGKREFFADRFQTLRRKNSLASADQRFLISLPRYAMEVAMVVGAGVIVTVLSLTQDAERAFASMALFLTASSRVIPSLLRLNNARISLHAVAGRAQRTIELKALIDTEPNRSRLPPTAAGPPLD